MWDMMTSVIPLALTYTAPLLIIALGGLYSERSGVVNIGLEGLMGIGAFAAAIFTVSSQGAFGGATIWLALVVAALAGMLLSFFHALASVSLKADQVISGTAINMFSAAITIYMARWLTGSANIQIRRSFIRTNIPVLSDIPIIGPLLFTRVYLTTYVVFLFILISWFLLYKTKFGLRLRACGENPHSADSMGVNVTMMRYIGVLISGFLAGLGGGIVIMTYSKEFSQLTYNGLGFLALAALIFGKWKPIGILGSSLFFGIAMTISNISVIVPSLRDVPNIFLNTFPYVATLIALVLFSNSSVGPKAAGEPYDVGKR
ncbi:ABC transporter permease [Serpentinicella sp. ANB-PHB4]|uniref:ABC transporter permease n=1 Tax=Serpentinicella sp. ANB-PHB4 TaxID=3074076 RepID=UPI00285B00A9|nr:ABC transporter permease [Serpentinicella sp. ANB-PHB4]MDR5659968.1 ABC transporter permease [Serpentinicella sp. ANB-PHB4]